MKTLLLTFVLSSFSYWLFSQQDTIILGYGYQSNIAVMTSSNAQGSNGDHTIDQSGFLPNENAASRFLAQATLGYNLSDIDSVMTLGIEDWIDNQLSKPISFTLLDKIKEYHEFVRTETNNPSAGQSYRFWNYAWWQYHMTSDDVLRQKVALALSEILVISDKSAFAGRSHAVGSYYDVLLEHAFGNYKDLLTEVTYHPSMGVYLTYLNNPKSNPAANQFPDENYAREVMQLFTIGTTKLNIDGTMVYDNDGIPQPTYDNDDILELSKVFTGLSWGDRTIFNRGAYADSSYTIPMIMFNAYHEAGVKNLLNGYQIHDRNPVDGIADINDAIDHLFNHPNVPPFVCKYLIQRLVTSNPSPMYVQRVAEIFINNGQGVRGDLAAVVKAILLDPEANSCQSGNEVDFGMLKEPFTRYVQINKALNVSTISGNYRNDMDYIYRFTQQKPMTSPSVFNFFQKDYQPIGVVEEADLVAPEFQITNAQSIIGYVNGLYRFVFQENMADEYDLYSGEVDSTYADEISTLDFSEDILLADDVHLHILLDKMNLLFSGGRLSDYSINVIKEAVMAFPSTTETEKKERVKMAIYLMLSSPEYLIQR